MKKTINNFILTILFIFATSTAYTQIEITPQFGYQIGSKYNFYNGYVKLTGSEQYGITLDVDINGHGTQLELFWVYQDSEVRILDYFLSPYETFITNITANHFQIGAIQNFQDGDFRPFAGLSGGFTIFDPMIHFIAPAQNSHLDFQEGLNIFSQIESGSDFNHNY